MWSNQENATKPGAKLRVWRETDSDEKDQQMPYVHNEMEGYDPNTAQNNVHTSGYLLVLIYEVLNERFRHSLSEIRPGVDVSSLCTVRIDITVYKKIGNVQGC